MTEAKTGSAVNRLSSRVRSVRPSPTLSMAAMTRKLQEAGRNVIILSMGEPDFDTEEFIKEAGIAAIRRNETKYTEVSGTKAMRQALADKFQRDNGIAYTPDQIIVSSGLKLIIYNAIFATVEPGEEIIIPAPYWVSYPDIAMLAGAKPVFVPCHEKNGFRLDPADLEKAIGPKTRMLILNTPSNPSGATYSAAQLRELGAVLERHPNVIVLTDEIYEHLVYDGFKAASMASALNGAVTESPRTSNTTWPRRFSTRWRPASGTRPVIAAAMSTKSP